MSTVDFITTPFYRVEKSMTDVSATPTSPLAYQLCAGDILFVDRPLLRRQVVEAGPVASLVGSKSRRSGRGHARGGGRASISSHDGGSRNVTVTSPGAVLLPLTSFWYWTVATYAT